MRIFLISVVTVVFSMLSAGGVRSENRETIAALAERLKDDNVTVRRAASHALKYLPGNEAAIPALVDVLKDADEVVGENAVEALSLMYPKDAVPPLVQALKDNSANVRRRAAKGLGYFPRFATNAIPDLIDLLKDDNAEVRQAAAATLSKLQGGRWQ